VLALLVPAAAQTGNPCDTRLLQQTQDPLAYRLRGERCEGVYVRDVAGAGGFSVVGFIEASPTPIGIERNEPLHLAWEPSDDVIVNVRAVSLRRRLYYRMDARQPAGATGFDWPMDVVGALDLGSDELGVVAWIQRDVGGTEQEVYVPVRVSRAGTPAQHDGYVVQVVPGTELTEVFVTLAAVDASGRDEATVVRDGPLRRGFYPAGRVIPIRLPSLPRPGLYRLQLNAVLTSGVPASRGLYFRHTGG
jgi:hypothetical protein